MTTSSFEDTIVAAATVPGTGAISVIRISGRDAVALADGIVDTPLAGAKGYSSHFGHVIAAGTSTRDSAHNDDCPYLKTDGIEVVDEVIVTVFRAPKSYTGEDCVEISCHASSYIVSRIIFLLIEAGARQAEPGEFTQRAFLAGKMDLTQAEAVADVIASQNAAAHRIAMNQMRGGFSNELQEMRGKLLEMTSLMELELDFSEEEVEFADRSVLRELLEQVLSHVSRLRESFKLGNAIKNGVPVAIAGAVNTGKSTLLNALLGEDRAIVSDIPGTTRDTVEDTIIIEGLPFRLIDTAGIRETSEEIEKIGIQRSFSKISSADIILGVIDYTKPLEVILNETKDLVSNVDLKSQYLIILLNKADILGSNKNVRPFNKDVLFTDLSLNSCENFQILEISAKTGSGLSKLKESLKVIEQKRESSAGSILVANARHFEALGKAEQCLRNVRKSLDLKIPTDLISQDLREALYHLGTITGEISTDEVLGEIFGKFCIGK